MQVSSDAPCTNEDADSIRESRSSTNRLESELYLLSLPSDTLIHIWTYFSARELEDRSRRSNRKNDGNNKNELNDGPDVPLPRNTIRFVCRQFYHLCREQPVWHHHCQMTGKLVKDDPNAMIRVIDYRTLYHSIPCVGVDCPTISSAIDQLKFQRHWRKIQKKNRNQSASRRTTSADYSVVTVMPGIYRESVRIEASHFILHVPSVKRTIRDAYDDGSDNGNADNGNGNGNNDDDGELISICIRAAFPCGKVGNNGVTLVYDDDHEEEDKPCINVSKDVDYYDDDPGDSSDRHCPSVYLHVENIRFLHYSPGNDIWAGNSCIRVDGRGNKLSMKNCTLESRSGRGIVATGGSMVYLARCTIHDCAATGLYIADPTTHGWVENSNIIRNGVGSIATGIRSRRRNPVETSEVEGEDHLNQVDNLVNHNLGLILPAVPPIPLRASNNNVPPGHSGMYVESAMCLVKNSLIAGNSLTGLSVVRGGHAKLSLCHIIDNGSEALTFQDDHDVFLGFDPGRFMIRGGVEDCGNNTLGGSVDHPLQLERARSFLRPMSERSSKSTNSGSSGMMVVA